MVNLDSVGLEAKEQTQKPEQKAQVEQAELREVLKLEEKPKPRIPTKLELEEAIRFSELIKKGSYVEAKRYFDNHNIDHALACGNCYDYFIYPHRASAVRIELAHMFKDLKWYFWLNAKERKVFDSQDPSFKVYNRYINQTLKSRVMPRKA